MVNEQHAKKNNNNNNLSSRKFSYESYYGYLIKAILERLPSCFVGQQQHQVPIRKSALTDFLHTPKLMFMSFMIRVDKMNAIKA